MGRSTISGPLRLGTVQNTAEANLGYPVITQTATFTQNSTTAVDVTFYLPANSQIVGFNNDVLVAYDSATSATLSAGTSSGATTYMSGVNVKAAAGRIAPTYTAAQLTAMANITTNTTVVCTITVVGATTAGNGVITISYIQKS